MKHLFVMTGAGISAESGLNTFRNSGAESLWSKYDPFELATPEAFRVQPDTVFEFTNILRRSTIAACPNPAHIALASLEASLRNRGCAFTLVTQNVDDLHERAGSTNVIHIHGEILKKRCIGCGTVSACNFDLSSSYICADCGSARSIRPHLVWFGETPLFMDMISQYLQNAELFAAIGTSGTVYPAAGFVAEAKNLGIRTCEINLETAVNNPLFDEAFHGPAGKIVPIWCQSILASLDADG